MTDIESRVLGAMLMEPELSTDALDILKPEHFSDPDLSTVYKAVHKLYTNKQDIDLVTVCEELKKMGVIESLGGYYFVSSLTNKIASAGHIEAHARIIQQEFLNRKIAEILNRANYKLSEPQTDPFELITEIEGNLSSLIGGVVQNKISRVDEVRDIVISENKEVLKSGRRSGIPCSIDRLNNQTNGWQKGDLVIMAGRPGMGKTSAALDFVLYPALNGRATAMFSLEMSKEQLTGRILSIISSLNVQSIINKTMDAGQILYLENQAQVLNGVPLFIDDTPGITLFDLRNKARKLKRTQNIELIVVDYLQLMNGENKRNGNREQEISNISRGLKGLAKELQVPVIALSQLSRECEKRPDKKPMLSDLRESGAIEQDADMVIFNFRPEYYGMDTYQLGMEEIPADGLFMFIIAKFRNGSPGEVRARFVKENTMITNYNV
jgi:replicative DNA helicase